MKKQLYLLCWFFVSLNNPIISQNIDWIYYDSTNTELTGLLSNYYTHMEIDLHHNRWLLTWDNHLVKFDGANWKVYELPNKSNSGVSTFCADMSNSLWLDKQDTLWKFDGSEWSHYTSSNYGLPGAPHRITVDRYNNKWMGFGDPPQLVKYNDKDWLVYNSGNSPITGDWVQSIAVDSLGNKWIATERPSSYYPQRGLFMLHSDDKTWTVIDDSITGLTESYIIEHIKVDSKNNVWVLSYHFSKRRITLFKFDNKKWTKFEDDIETNHGFSGNRIAVDKNNNIWIGNRGGMLKKFDGTIWTYCDRNKYLPYESIEFLKVDKYNNKWIGNYGIVVFNEGGVVTDVDNQIARETVPEDYLLSQNYPNPFNPSTTIKYSIPSRSIILSDAKNLKDFLSQAPQNDNANVTLKIYDILGREVATLVNQKQKPGNYEVVWNAVNQSSGIYFYRLQGGDFMETKKMLMIK